jgi:rfaE bifunctional protein kinase chain/domain/rfaE bifunctional protein nucleotidyltransferase chain/domain
MKYLSNSFKSKIFSIGDLVRRVAKEKKHGKKIVMCHGTFDLVHPGHIRHLYYAKEKGDILIVSLTGDKFVTKKTSGTYVPEDLRVRNIAALELVDYTFIDQDYTPIKSIKRIKPDLFVKGFEYNDNDNANDKTLDEKEAVEKFGGKIIFSPGDVVYSSTKFQKTLKPDLKYEKFNSLLKKENISLKSIIQLLNKKHKIKIHVIGDVIIDKYNYCDLIGQSTKTPTFSIRPFKSEKFVGGSGIVAKHLKSLGADVVLTTLAGEDEHKKFLEEDLKKNKINLNILLNKSKQTVFKERFWCDNYKVIQVDYVDNSIIENNNQKKILNIISKNDYDCIVFSDFRHGMFNKEIIKLYSDLIHPGVTKVADSQVSSRWGNITDFAGFDILFPNEMEARFSLADQDSGVRSVGAKIIEKSNCKNLVLKLGDKGSMIFRNKGFNAKDFFPLDSFVKNKVDTIGAGDAYLAGTTYFYSITKDIVISSVIGNFAAAIACEQDGNVPISKEQIISFIKKINFK